MISPYWPMVVLLIILEVVVFIQAGMITRMRDARRHEMMTGLAQERRIRATRERRDEMAWRAILDDRADSPFRTEAETAFLIQWAGALGATPDEARAVLNKLDRQRANDDNMKRPPPPVPPAKPTPVERH